MQTRLTSLLQDQWPLLLSALPPDLNLDATARQFGAFTRRRGVPSAEALLRLALGYGQFKSARHFAAWIGLTPRQNSSGGKQRLGGISRQGNERLRQLLFAGAMAVISHAVRPGSKTTTAWLQNMLNRQPRKVVAVALANKMARIAWAMMTSGEVYRSTPKAV
jgi:transposase